MGMFPFEISAQLVATVQQDQVFVVAEENYVIINFKDHAALERVMKNMMPAPSATSSKGGGGLLAALDKAKDLSRNLLDAGIVVDVRVNNKTYVEIGSSTSPKISANVVWGKVGSWFS